MSYFQRLTASDIDRMFAESAVEEHNALKIAAVIYLEEMRAPAGNFAGLTSDEIRERVKEYGSCMTDKQFIMAWHEAVSVGYLGITDESVTGEGRVFSFKASEYSIVPGAIVDYMGWHNPQGDIILDEIDGVDKEDVVNEYGGKPENKAPCLRV